MADKLSYTGTIFDTSRQDAVTPEKNQSALQCHHEDVRALLRNASVPMEFKQSVQDVLPDPRLSSFTFPGELVTGANTCLENAPSEMKIRQDPAGLSATPEYVPQSFYLTDAMINLPQIKHATAGLQCFDTRPLSALITNTFFLEPCFYPPVYWCPCPDDDKEIKVCVRFFVVDACDDEEKKQTKEQGILEGVTYPAYKEAPHLGRLPNGKDSTMSQIMAVLDKANAIWKQCTIKFELATNPKDKDKEFIYGLNLKLLADYDITPFRLFYEGSILDLEFKKKLTFASSCRQVRAAN